MGKVQIMQVMHILIYIGRKILAILLIQVKL